MKFKTCKILLVSEDKKELLSWIEKYKQEFKSIKNPVQSSDIRKCEFKDGQNIIVDYRAEVIFTSKLSKNNIYFLSNQIKANPINFAP